MAGLSPNANKIKVEKYITPKGEVVYKIVNKYLMDFKEGQDIKLINESSKLYKE